MSAYKSFAVVGGGLVGLPIVSALAAKNASVILLSRPGSSPKTVPPGVPVITVDFQDANAIAKVLQAHNVDVVLSTVATFAVAVQTTLVDASKIAGIKLFVPSEYGLPTEGHSEGPLGHKAEIAKQLKSANIPSTRIYVRCTDHTHHGLLIFRQTGIFTDVLPWLLNIGGKTQLVGQGERKFSLTAVPDIAGFVAHVLTTSPASELEDRVLRLEGERITLNEIAAQFNLKPEYVETITDGEHAQFKEALMRVIEEGKGSTGWDVSRNAEGTGSDAAGGGNALWPGHCWLTAKEVHKL
ncbi:NmrA domain-containing protein [Favolaschia claudopus]|uniref:NmrA domain-containing protein n=1 Tax=Favolaschia claudopus TaxID=2862362 RepID=A0AAW0CMK7_9AGAR